MNEQEKQSVRAVLEAALHNAKVIQNQLESLVNPKDKSFTDFPMPDTVVQIKEAVAAIEKAIKEL